MPRYLLRTGSQAANLLLRLLAGLVFFSEGLRKSLLIERGGCGPVNNRLSHPHQP